jgi:pimeloyl-ACP methyl ester carboxylesterase
MKDSQVIVGGGRELAYTDIGDPRGPCIFFFHGAPMSRLHLVAFEKQFAAHGLRVISPDRPAYGRSSAHPGRSLLDWPADVAALADALEIDQFLVAGHSSGGPYPLVCAVLLGGRVLGGVVMAGVTDMAWRGAWKGYLEGRHEIQVMRLPDERAAIALSVERFGADGSGVLAEPFDWPEADLAFLADETVDKGLTSAVAEAFRQGVTGYAQDVYLEGRGWPFDPRGISVPVEVVHGESDTLVPMAHSRHTAGLIPGSTFRTLPGHGHLTILSELPKTAADLMRAVGDARANNHS